MLKQQVSRLPSLKVSVSFRESQPKTLQRYFTSLSRFDTPDHEKAELFRVFQMFDRDGDGRLSLEEIRSSLAKLGIVVSFSDLQSLVGDPDGNADTARAYLEFDDFCSLYRALLCEDEDDLSSCPNGTASGPDLWPVFALFDKNDDGYISAVELQSVLLNLGFKEASSLDLCRHMIDRVDSDGDGRVNFFEFSIMMRDMGEKNLMV